MSKEWEFNNPGKDYFESFAPPVSYDGETRRFRAQDNYEKIARDSKGDDNYQGWNGTGSGNQDYLAFLQPLYEESEADVNRAGYELGIKNVNSLREAKDIKEYIANGFSNKTAEDADTEAEVDPPKLSQEDLGIATGEQRQEDIDRKTEEYNENFDDGLPWQASDPSETYDRVFNEAREGGSKLTGAFGGFSVDDSARYLNARAGDKKKSVAEYIDYGRDRDSLTVAETHNSAMDFIENMGLLGVKPPELDDPRESFDYYADQIRGAA